MQSNSFPLSHNRNSSTKGFLSKKTLIGNSVTQLTVNMLLDKTKVLCDAYLFIYLFLAIACSGLMKALFPDQGLNSGHSGESATS